MNWQSSFTHWLLATDRAEQTISAYTADLQQYAEWFAARYGQTFEPGQLAATDVRSYRQHLQDCKLAAASINRKLVSLRVLALWAIEQGHIAAEHNPVQHIKYIETQPQAPRWLNDGELRRILAAYERAINAEAVAKRTARFEQAVRGQAMLHLMAGAGLRVAEACALDLDDIVLSPRSGMVLIRQGKGGHAAELPLSAEVRHTLEAWLAVRGEAAGPLFTSQKGNRISPRAVQAQFAEMARRAGVEDATPHAFRHTFIKRGVERMPFNQAQTLARHADPQQTLRYAQPGRQELAAAVEGVTL